jgi:hypothetical protein
MSELAEHHTCKIDDADRETFMSFGLLRDLNRAFPNPQDPAQVFHNPTQFETALWLMLVPRTKTGKLLVEEFDLDTVEIDSQAAIVLVKWGMEHLTRFFLRKLSQLATLGENSVKEMEDLLSAYPGLKALASMSLSAGPTASSEAGSESTTSLSPTET